MGLPPGKHSRGQWFTKVDSLWMKEGFQTDASGVFRMSDIAIGRLVDMVSRDTFGYREDQCAEVYGLAAEAVMVKRGVVIGELPDLYRRVSSIPEAGRTPWEHAVTLLVDSPLNSDGFRSIPFRHLPNDRPSVLLLGDSFTFGYAAGTRYNSFGDVLLARGYTVYNSGVTATDPAQYLAVAQEWIPRLRPDVVVVNFYLGNDVAYHRREFGEGRPVFFPTNATNLMACPNGIYFDSAKEAYELAFRWHYIPPDAGTLAQRMSKTSVTTAIWKVLRAAGLMQYHDSLSNEYWSLAETLKHSPPYCKTELMLMDSMARANGAVPIISVIPDVRKGIFKTSSDFPDVFEGLGFVEMAVTEEDYSLWDGHFNDRGHSRYADFLQGIIDTSVTMRP